MNGVTALCWAPGLFLMLTCRLLCLLHNVKLVPWKLTAVLPGRDTERLVWLTFLCQGWRLVICGGVMIVIKDAKTWRTGLESVILELVRRYQYSHQGQHFLRCEHLSFRLSSCTIAPALWGSLRDGFCSHSFCGRLKWSHLLSVIANDLSS